MRFLSRLFIPAVLVFATLPAFAKDKNPSFGSFGIVADNAWGRFRLWLSADGDSYIQKYLLGSKVPAGSPSPLYIRYRFRLSPDEVAHFTAFLRQKSPWGANCREKSIVYDATTTTIWQQQGGKLRAVCQPPEPLHRSVAFWAVYKFADKLDGTGPSIEIYRGGFDEWSPPGFPTDAEISKALRNAGG
ncbi:hypothetical protein ACETRX_19500 [Labrys portucalensis]|uniref:Uncharacterized protein n=1 Tax=Labrys neptuniae TaxID=376174 RepID=A0ABV6ZI25_9HYPH